MPDVAERERFNTQVGPTLARIASKSAAVSSIKASTRFAYLETDDALFIVAGVQEGTDCDLAVAYGLKLCGARRLVVILPRRFALATVQRAAFLRHEVQPTVWVHDVPHGGDADHKLERWGRLSRKQATERLLAKLGEKSPADELDAAATPTHLGDRKSVVADLTEWATSHPGLDSGHRRGERSWHCMGQKVLSIRGTRGSGIEVRAGIHYSSADKAPSPHRLSRGGRLSAAGLSAVKAQVQEGIRERLEGDLHRPDEHWLQAVIRRRPELVGVEQPALRELPAWRPVGGASEWGRGYIDLVGLDGHGDLRIVETKLAANTDDLLIFQGLDYYICAQVYGNAIRGRLGAPKRAELVVHYVVGATPGTNDDHVSVYAPAQAKALDIPWRFQVIGDWFEPPVEQKSKMATRLLPEGKLPPRARSES